jgi:cytochrome c oxidase assembly protein Cox11
MREPAKPQHPYQAQSRDFFAAFLAGAFAVAMVGASYAALPLYSWFGRTAALGGAAQVATWLPASEPARLIPVRFDSDVASGLPRSPAPAPERHGVDMRLGQVVIVYSKVVAGEARHDGVRTVTLTYAFYPARKPARPAAASAAARPAAPAGKRRMGQPGPI